MPPSRRNTRPPPKRSSPAPRRSVKPRTAAEPKAAASKPSNAPAPPAAESLESRFAAAIVQFGVAWPGAVAVSGGGDSLALMLLLADWTKAEAKPAPVVLTVDHGLRAESHKEAERVRKLATAAGLKAHILPWKGAKPPADVEAEARTARYSLMGRWCAENRVPALYVAHTQEDQAETFLLRLARGSGVDGLAGMQAISALPVPEFSHIRLARPVLNFTRDELRAFLKERKVVWSDDPMNTDPRFSRARIRAAWPQLIELGLTPPRITDAAAHLARARAALEQLTDDFLHRGARFAEDTAALDPLRLKLLPREIGLRALAKALSYVSGEEYRPRFESLERLFDSIVVGTLGGGATLHGCIVAPARAGEQVFGTATITLSRESSRNVREPAAPAPRKSEKDRARH